MSSKQELEGRRLRNAVRAAAGQNALTREPIVVSYLQPDLTPVLAGHPARYETRGGTVIDHPSSYSKSGWSNMIYKNSTLQIVVGIEALASIASRVLRRECSGVEALAIVKTGSTRACLSDHDSDVRRLVNAF